MDTTAPDYRERFYSAQNGLRLYFRDYGDPLSSAVPLLCLSGLTRNSKDFHRLAVHHATRRRVIAPDYRGRGRSQYDRNWRNYAPPVILGDIIQLLAATNLHGVVVCGVSFGGMLAMALSVAAPTTLVGAILDDVGPEVNPVAGRRILDYVSRDRPQPDWDAAISEVQRRCPNLSFSTRENWKRFTEGTFREGPDGQLHFDWDVNLAKPLLQQRHDRPDLWPLYRALAQRPVLAIRGGLSDVLTETTLERMVVEKPNLERVVLPNVGHAPTLEEPEAERAIDDFFERIEG